MVFDVTSLLKGSDGVGNGYAGFQVRLTAAADDDIPWRGADSEGNRGGKPPELVIVPTEISGAGAIQDIFTENNFAYDVDNYAPGGIFLIMDGGQTNRIPLMYSRVVCSHQRQTCLYQLNLVRHKIIIYPEIVR